MSEINSFSDYSSKYNTNQDYSFLFGAAQSASTSGSFSLTDYMSIKNGSYGKYGIKSVHNAAVAGEYVAVILYTVLTLDE